MKIFTSLMTAILFLGINFSLQAQDEFESVRVLDNPRFSLTDRLVLDTEFSFFPLDGYYKPVFLEVAASYQWNDFISIEPVRFGYAIYNHDTGLKKAIEAKTSTVLADEPLKDMRFHVGTAGYVNLLYSKSNFFNSAVVYHYWQAGAGVSYYDLDKESQMGLDLMLRVRFFLNENLTLNVRGGHTIGFQSPAPKNMSFLGMGVGVAF
jgi:hypothetical protein